MAQGRQATGGCGCGAVRFTAAIEADHIAACHCGMCRRWSGGPFVCVQATDFTVADDASLGVWSSSEWANRLFCKTCGSSIAYRLKDGAMTVIGAYLFDEPLGLTLTTEIFIDDQPLDYAFSGTTTRMTGAEILAMFGD